MSLPQKKKEKNSKFLLLSVSKGVEGGTDLGSGIWRRNGQKGRVPKGERNLIRLLGFGNWGEGLIWCWGGGKGGVLPTGSHREGTVTRQERS